MADKSEITEEKRDLAYRILCVLSMNIIIIILMIPGIIRKIREFIYKRKKAVIKYEWTVDPSVEKHYENVKNALLQPEIHSRELNSLIEDMLLETMVRNSAGDIEDAFAEDFKTDVADCTKLENMQKEKKNAIKLVTAAAAAEADYI